MRLMKNHRIIATSPVTQAKKMTKALLVRWKMPAIGWGTL